MKKYIYSFDVFDTCLARLCGEPYLMFDVLSYKVGKLMNYPYNEHLRQAFVIARAKANGTTLNEIYNNVAQQFPVPCNVNEMVALELETERKMLVPIIATRTLIERLREKGKIIFISDMYLPSSFIQERLSEFGFFKEGDQLYVSEELQAWKYDGSLYKLIHEKTGIPYRYWHHYGDNQLSDIKIPRKYKIHTHKINYKYLPYEDKWRQTPLYQNNWPSIMAGISRALRLQSTAPKEQCNFICDISAPLMISYILNVLEDASRKRIKKLFFCARDMHSYFLIAKQFSHLFPSLEIHYVFISSEVLYKNTQYAVAYFKQIGLASKDILTAIIDTHTSGGTLPAINNMLINHGYNKVRSYHIAGSGKPPISKEDCLLCSYGINSQYNMATGQRNAAKIPGMRILYELVFCLNYHKKTVSYEPHGNTIRPVFAEDKEDIISFKDTNLKKIKQSNDKLLIEYAEAIVKTGLSEYGNEILNLLALPTLVDFTSYPDKIYLSYLHGFQLSGHSFVGNLYGRKRSLWKRGSIVYNIPNIIVKLFVPIVRKEKVRHLLLKIH